MSEIIHYSFGELMKYFNGYNFKLYHGDCVDVMKSMPDKSFDMIFADPPYFLSDGSFTCVGGERAPVKKGDWDIGLSKQEQCDFHFTWVKECRRILKDTGTIWISGSYHSIYFCGASLHLNDFYILNEIIWYKLNPPPNLACKVFTAGHETLIWAKKDKKFKHTFNYDLMKNTECDASKMNPRN